jgi:protein-tyrosine phosphatase
MIDLHCHMLPGIDDGSPDEATSLEMARIAVADGIETTACTPHIYPGLYENDAEGIKTRVKALQARLVEEGIALKLTIGADAHLTPELLGRLKAGTAPSLAGGRYFLLEPSAHGCAAAVLPKSMFDFVAAATCRC